MVILKIVGKILLVPVWIIVAMTWLLVKAVVAVYSFARGFVVLGLGMLIVGTLICYQDWRQVIFLLSISVVTLIVLFTGVMIEVCLETLKNGIGHTIKI